MLTTWILVSDAARGRLFEASGTPAVWTELACYSNPDLRGLPGQGGSGRTVPRTQESVGSARHAIEPRTTRRDKSTKAFAHLIASELMEAHAHHRYERLFLVAPPHFLGALREQLGDLDAASVAGELGSDLASLSKAELIQHVQDAFPRHFRGTLAQASYGSRHTTPGAEHR